MNREQEATHPSDAAGLDPRSDPERWEHLVTRINEAAAPILAERQPQTVTSILSAWRAPVAVGSFGLVAAAVMALVFLPGQDVSDSEATLAEAVMPWPVAAWMDGSYAPTVEELVQAVEGYTP